MASSSGDSSSSSSPILCASFNQDNSCFVIGTKDGFKVFDAKTDQALYTKAMGAYSIVEMLFTSDLVAVVGAGDQPELSPRRLCLFNTTTEIALREMNYLTSILAVRFNKKRLVVVLQDNAYVYDLNSVNLLDTIGTVTNMKGLCAFSPNSEGCYLALPASASKGSVLVYNTVELQSVCQIDAHHSPLATIAFSSSGMYLATASEKGTIIRVHLVSQATKSYSFRRGSYSSTIYSLSFGPSMEFPDVLVATSLSGSLHLFCLGPTVDKRKSQSKVLGFVIPNKISDAIDHPHHHVLHNVVPPGIKSYAAVYSTDNKQSDAGGSCLSSSVYIISHNGYFREFILKVDNLDKFSWSLEREVNLLDPTSYDHC